MPSPKIIIDPEIIAKDCSTGDGSNQWGGHQSRIVRTKDGVFTAYTSQPSGETNRDWHFRWQKKPGDTWIKQDGGNAGREPVHLLAGPDGTLYVIGWPEKQATIWTCTPKPGDNEISLGLQYKPNLSESHWPYGAAGIDFEGNMCIVSSDNKDIKPGTLRYTYLDKSKNEWHSRESNLAYRHCYAYVMPQPNLNLKLIATRDVKWKDLGYTKPEGCGGSCTPDYVFNSFSHYSTDNVKTKTITRAVTTVDEQPTSRYQCVQCNAQRDAYLDTEGNVHVIYTLQGQTTDGEVKLRYLVISPDWHIIYQTTLPKDVGHYARIFQDDKERFYILGMGKALEDKKTKVKEQHSVIYSLGNNYRSPMENSNRTEFILKFIVEQTGFAVSVPRGGTPLSDIMDVVYPREGGKDWVYFRIQLYS